MTTRPQRPLLEITGDLVGKRHAVLGERYGKAWANLSMRVLRALFNFVAANYEVGGKALVLDNPVKRLSRTRARGSDVTAGYVVASTERLREPMQKITNYVLRCAGVEVLAEVLPFERADRPQLRVTT